MVSGGQRRGYPQSPSTAASRSAASPSGRRGPLAGTQQGRGLGRPARACGRARTVASGPRAGPEAPGQLQQGGRGPCTRWCGEVDSEPIPPPQVRPEEDLLSWHTGGLCEEGLPIKGEIDKIEIFLHVLPAPEG